MCIYICSLALPNQLLSDFCLVEYQAYHRNMKMNKQADKIVFQVQNKEQKPQLSCPFFPLWH